MHLVFLLFFEKGIQLCFWKTAGKQGAYPETLKRYALFGNSSTSQHAQGIQLCCDFLFASQDKEASPKKLSHTTLVVEHYVFHVSVDLSIILPSHP